MSFQAAQKGGKKKKIVLIVYICLSDAKKGKLTNKNSEGLLACVIAQNF